MDVSRCQKKAKFSEVKKSVLKLARKNYSRCKEEEAAEVTSAESSRLSHVHHPLDGVLATTVGAAWRNPIGSCARGKFRLDKLGTLWDPMVPACLAKPAQSCRMPLREGLCQRDVKTGPVTKTTQQR
jgi:hypothetical protein